MEMPIEAASVYFLIGMCHSELSKPLDALSAFNNAIRVNPDYAEVTNVAFTEVLPEVSTVQAFATVLQVILKKNCPPKIIGRNGGRNLLTFLYLQRLFRPKFLSSL